MTSLSELTSTNNKESKASSAGLPPVSDSQPIPPLISKIPQSVMMYICMMIFDRENMIGTIASVCKEFSKMVTGIKNIPLYRMRIKSISRVLIVKSPLTYDKLTSLKTSGYSRLELISTAKKGDKDESILQVSDYLTSLRISGCKIERSLFDILPQYESLLEFYISDYPKIDCSIVAMISKMTWLKKLMIKGCNLSNKKARYLHRLRNLEWLDLSNNNLSMVTFLNRMPSLSHVDLSHNNLTLNCLKVFDAITSLTYLVILGNPKLDMERVVTEYRLISGRDSLYMEYKEQSKLNSIVELKIPEIWIDVRQRFSLGVRKLLLGGFRAMLDGYIPAVLIGEENIAKYLKFYHYAPETLCKTAFNILTNKYGKVIKCFHNIYYSSVVISPLVKFNAVSVCMGFSPVLSLRPYEPIHGDGILVQPLHGYPTDQPLPRNLVEPPMEYTQWIKYMLLDNESDNLISALDRKQFHDQYCLDQFLLARKNADKTAFDWIGGEIPPSSSSQAWSVETQTRLDMMSMGIRLSESLM